MSQRDRKWHQLRSLIAGETDHHSLIAGPHAVESIDLLAGADLDGLRHSTQDLRALVLDRDHDAAGIGVKPVHRVRVADLIDGLPHDRWNVDIGGGRDLAE